MNPADANHKANQSNPTSPAHRRVNDNRSNQGNPTSPTYRSSRGQAPRQSK